MDNLTEDEMFAIDAIEMGVTPENLQMYFEAEIDETHEPDTYYENEWNMDRYGTYFFPYFVNGIQCVVWEMLPYYVLEYGDRVYELRENAEVYDMDGYVGVLTDEGDIHYEGGA